MITLRLAYRLQDHRARVRLEDGRVGSILRLDTTFPENRTEVSVATEGPSGPGIARVRLEELSEVRDAS